MTTASAPTSVTVHPTQPHLALVSLTDLPPVLVDLAAGTSTSIRGGEAEAEPAVAAAEGAEAGAVAGAEGGTRTSGSPVAAFSRCGEYIFLGSPKGTVRGS